MRAGPVVSVFVQPGAGRRVAGKAMHSVHMHATYGACTRTAPPERAASPLSAVPTMYTFNQLPGMAVEFRRSFGVGYPPLLVSLPSETAPQM